MQTIEQKGVTFYPSKKGTKVITMGLLMDAFEVFREQTNKVVASIFIFDDESRIVGIAFDSKKFRNFFDDIPE